MTGSVYLAGPITGLSFRGADDWRQATTRQLADVGIQGLSPLRHKDYLAAKTELADTYGELSVLSGQKGITTRDRWDCQRADVVLVNLVGAARVSIGTMIELGWADAARRPIVVAIEETNVHHHAMVREVAGFLVPTLAEAVAVTLALLS